MTNGKSQQLSLGKSIDFGEKVLKKQGKGPCVFLGVGI
jgi:hypothetical protein